MTQCLMHFWACFPKTLGDAKESQVYVLEKEKERLVIEAVKHKNITTKRGDRETTMILSTD